MMRIALRVILGLLPLLLLFQPAKLQERFQGGEGGGYAMLSVVTHPTTSPADSLVGPSPEISISPNPIPRGNPITVRVNGVHGGTRMAVSVTDILGNRVHSEEITASPVVSLSLRTNGLPAGIYLVSFSTPRHKITRRLTITQ